MSRTLRWAVDFPKTRDKKIRQYYSVFNSIYYYHKKPTTEDCRILNISMEQAEELRRCGYYNENHQRKDLLNFSMPLIDEESEEPIDFDYAYHNL